MVHLASHGVSSYELHERLGGGLKVRGLGLGLGLRLRLGLGLGLRLGFRLGLRLGFRLELGLQVMIKVIGYRLRMKGLLEASLHKEGFKIQDSRFKIQDSRFKRPRFEKKDERARERIT